MGLLVLLSILFPATHVQAVKPISLDEVLPPPLTHSQPLPSQTPPGPASQQDFTWGVLGINTNKSIYLPGEIADIALAVLDEKGAMVCDAVVELEVSTPSGGKTVLSTQDNDIIVNPECAIKGKTERPDYQTAYSVKEVGIHELKLTTVTKNGARTITDSFEVHTSAIFDVERKGPTRIFPADAYPMRIDVLAQEDFSGTVTETVPDSFAITPLVGVKAYSETTRRDNYGESVKVLSWDVAVKKGERLQLGYVFDAPDESPEFYSLGPLEFESKGQAHLFREARRWQIAADTTAGTTRFYLHSKDASEEDATYNSMLPSVFPEGDTEVLGTDNSTTNFTAPPCEAAGFDQDTTARVNEETISAERCVATFYSPILDANMQMDTGDTNSISYNMWASEEGGCATCVLTARLYEYVESGSTYNLIDTTNSAAITAAGMTNITWSATPDTSTTVDAGNRLVLVVTMNTGLSADLTGGIDTINVSFDRNLTTPAYMSVSYTLTTADKPDLTGSKDDDFDETASCASSCDGTTLLSSPTWNIETSDATTTESVQVGNGGSSGSTQWATITDVKTADAAGTSLADYTYMYQAPQGGDGDVTTQVSSSHSRVPNTDPRDLAGLLLRFSSDTDFLIMQSYYDGTNSVVEVNNSGVLTGTTATITGNANNILLRWSKSGTSYQAKYCASDVSDCTISGNWTSLGTAITKTGVLDRMGLATYVEWVTGTNTQYSASFEWFDSTLIQSAFDQSDYRWFDNADSVQPGSAIAAENIAATLSSTASPVRLRTALAVSVANLVAAAQQFKLQFATSTSGPWTDVGSSGSPWYNTSWLTRKKITVDETKVSGTTNLTNFPVLVSITDADLRDDAQDDGDDILFTATDGTTKLDHEIEKFDGATGELVAWVEVGTLNAQSNTDIYLYYTNTGATNQQNPTGTWSNGYEAVYHLHADENDSTTNSRNGTNTGSDNAAAQIADGQDFEQADTTNKIDVGTWSVSGSAITVQSWVKFESFALSDARIISKALDQGVEDHLFMLSTDTSTGFNRLRARIKTGISDTAGTTTLIASSGDLVTNTWYLVSVTYDGSGIRLVLDGVEVGYSDKTGNMRENTWSVFLGNNPVNGTSNHKPFDGIMDEPRVSSVARSADWLKTEYDNQLTPSTFYAVNGEESLTPPAWKYKDNATPADGTTITSALLSGSPVLESYEEGNPTIANPNAISSGSKGEWDFSLDPANASAGTTYYFRMTKANGTALDTYTRYPQITISGSNTAPDSPSSPAQKKTDDSTVATGEWVSATSMKFTTSLTDPDASDTLQLCVEKDVLGTGFSNTEDSCGTGVAYSGSAVTASVTLAGLTDASEYHWQARTKDAGGLYSSWVSYGGNAESARDFGLDTTAPSGGVVYDGTSTGVDQSFNDGSLSELSANWSGFDANVSGLNKYQYSIGTTAGGTDVKTWTDNSTTASVTATGLTLQTSKIYFFNVRALDQAGNTSGTVSSNGQLVAPSLSFSVSPATVTFANLNSSNSYTDTQATTLTTSTNAYGGYVVRAFATALPTAGGFTVTDFDGGSYALPDSWQGGDTGFGYTSSDSSVQGANKFQINPCPGGSALSAPGCYTPFTQSQPGDIVADHTATVSGSPIANQAFTVTYRATVPAMQAASRYLTTIVYSTTAMY